MRLLVDAQGIQSASSLRGIGRYALSLTHGLLAEAGEHRVEVLLSAGGEPSGLLRARLALEGVLPPRAVHVFDAAWPWTPPADERRRPAAEAAYAAAVRSLRPDALLVLSVMEDDRENVVSIGARPAGPPTAAVLYDLMPALDPGTYLMGPVATSYWRRLDQLAACDLLLAISEHTARQAPRAMPDRCPAVTTIWGAPYSSGSFPSFEEGVDAVPDLRLPARFVLSVGGDHPRKNLDRLVEAWGAVPRDLRRRSPLVLACRLNVGTVRRLERLATRGGVGPEELLLTGRVSDATLREMYNRADVFVFPSVEEGLGMPPLEAMAAGCPTLLARGSSLSELTSDEGVFFDPLDPADLAAALIRVLTDDDARDALRRSGAAAAEVFTWKRTAKLAWGALERLPSSNPPSERSAGNVVRLSDSAAVAALDAAPAPVLLDEAVPAGPIGVLGFPVNPRSALAPATALVAPTADAVGQALRSGLLDHPVLSTVDQVATSSAHDFHGAYAEGLSGLRVTEEGARAVVAAARRAPRWTLERPRPVWLLLTDDEPSPVVHAIAQRTGAELVVGRICAASLASQADVVLTPAAGVPNLLVALTDARCRGALVVALYEGDRAGLPTPSWCVDLPLEDPADRADDILARAGVGERTSGWPWRSGG